MSITDDDLPVEQDMTEPSQQPDRDPCLFKLGALITTVVFVGCLITALITGDMSLLAVPAVTGGYCLIVSGGCWVLLWLEKRAV